MHASSTMLEPILSHVSAQSWGRTAAVSMRSHPPNDRGALLQAARNLGQPFECPTALYPHRKPNHERILPCLALSVYL
jgi:hypothetical protein